MGDLGCAKRTEAAALAEQALARTEATEKERARAAEADESVCTFDRTDFKRLPVRWLSP